MNYHLEQQHYQVRPVQRSSYGIISILVAFLHPKPGFTIQAVHFPFTSQHSTKNERHTFRLIDAPYSLNG